MMTNPVELRPRRVGEVFGLTFNLYRRNFPLFIGIAAVVLVPILLITALAELTSLFQFMTAPGTFTNPDAPADVSTRLAVLVGLSSCLSLVGLILGIFWPWMEGALSYNVIERVLGRAPGLRESYRQTRPRWGALWGSNILAQLGIGVPIFIAYVLIAIGFLLTVASASALAGSTSSEDVPPGFFLCMSLLCAPVFIASVVISIVLAINWAFRAPVIAGEGTGGIQALSRSTAIARGDRWRILGRYLLLFILEFIVLVLPTLVVTTVLLIGLFAGRTPAELGRFETSALPTLVATFVIAVALSFLGTLLITPLRIVFTTVNYLDLRTRKEDLAVQMLNAAAAAATAQTPSEPLPVTPTPAQPQTTIVIPSSTSHMSPTPATRDAPASGNWANVSLAGLPPGQRIGVLFNRIRSDGESAQLLNDLGIAYMEVGDLGGALDALTRARAIAPNDADVAYNLMLVHLEHKDANTARQMMREYLRLETNPEDAERVRNNPRFKDLLPE